MPNSPRLASEGGTAVRETFLPFARASIGEDEKRALLSVLDSGWLTTGPIVQQLEADLGAALGVKHVVCLSSGTAAMHVALSLLDLQPGDEVVTSPLTFCSTAHAVVHAGGVPVFADVEDDTLNLAPEAVAKALTDRTRAVLAVHYGGHPADMDPIREVAAKRGLAVIEDAAHALGASYHSRPAGTLGDMGCFSFYVTKNITTGEGGSLVTDNDAYAERARLLSMHGMDRDAWKRYTAAGSWFYEVVAPGYKYNMTDLEAALGVEQLKRLSEFQKRRVALSRRYDERLKANPHVRIPTTREGVDHARHLYPIRVHGMGIDRSRFIAELRAENIGSSVHFVPVPMHPYYRDRFGFRGGEFPIAETAYEELVSLPLYPNMAEGDVNDVTAAIDKITDHFSG